MEYVAQKISKLILYLSGWQYFHDDKFVHYVKTKKRLIIAISHTSSWDAALFLIYKYAHPEVFGNSVIVVKPQIYDALPTFFHPFLDKIGLLKSTAYEEKHGGFVKSTTNILKNRESFLFLISPKGKRENTPWRSGYYNIAKKLDCEIIACGFDYEKKNIKTFDPVSSKDKSRQEIEQILQSQLSEIVPLNPEYSEVPIREHEKSSISLFTFSFVILALIIFMSYLSWNYKFLFIAILILFFILL